MVTQKEAKAHYESVRNRHTVYVWGFNFDTIINKVSIDKAYRDYHSATYDRAYYDKKLKEGQGKPGSDCSGQHYPLSGYDTTAQGYYDKCPERGPIDTLPLHDCVLLFKGKSEKSIKHTGTYYGNGMCEHMKNSKENCVYESVDKHGWTHWGKPSWIDYSEPLGDKPILTRTLKIGYNGIDVKLLQYQLQMKGYDCGIIDGDFGNKTYKAVKIFQNDRNLAVDGIVGKQTAKALGMLWRGPSY